MNVQLPETHRPHQSLKPGPKAEIIIIKPGYDCCDDLCFLGFPGGCFLMWLRRPDIDQVFGDLGNEGLRAGVGWG